ncbi:hypothetical protein MMC17_005190 [Xylographa soralifera]|nr:hypothetical protein [Xylographa soralifera]
MAGRGRLVPTLGVVALGTVGYYLYSAGGNPKVAEKQFEHDAASASARMKGDLPGKGKEAKLQGEVWAKQAGAKLDHVVDDAKATLHETDAKLSAKMAEADVKIDHLKADGLQKAKELRKDTDKKIDEFDTTVIRKTQEAKSGIASWFGFGK